ncbi:MAG: endolytic transglycosylase MltG [Lachnospiraceae bacterium]|nr:endolytic transglycosylase MltG [Lachnospiraceae bacterium]
MRNEDSSLKSISSILIGVAGHVIAITLLVLFAFTVVNFGYRFGYTVFCADSAEEAPGRDVEIVVEKGETIDELAEKLYADHVIPNTYAFRIQARLYDIGFYPGTYKVNTSMSTKEILKTIDLTEEEYEDKLKLEAASAETEDGIISGGDEGQDAAEGSGESTGADAADTAGESTESGEAQ